MFVSATPGALNLSAGLLVGVALSGTAFGAAYGALSRLFDPDKRSWALGVAGAIAAFIALPLSSLTVNVFAIVMGLVWLGTAPLTNGIVSRIFGVRYITTLFGFVFFGRQIGAFLGVWLGALVFDATHAYELVWFGSIVLGLLAVVLHWPIDDREVVRAAIAPANA